MKEIEFGGKLVVVTGAASGMGLYASKEFVRLGAKVIMCDVNEAMLKAEAEAIGGAAVPMKGMSAISAMQWRLPPRLKSWEAPIVLWRVPEDTRLAV